MSVSLDMNSQNYKYFETMNPGGAAQLSSDPNGNNDRDRLHYLHHFDSPFVDSSLQAHPFWQIFPHICGFLVLWFFIAIYFNTNALFFYPIMFFSPFVVSVFIILPFQTMFDSSLLPGIINNISWSFLFGGIGFFSIASMFNWLAPLIFENISPKDDSNDNDNDNNTITNDSSMDNSDDNVNYKQCKIVLTALVLTSMFDEIVKYWICHRGLKKYFSLSPPLSSIMNIILYCAAVGMGIGIAKGVIAVIILGNSEKIDDLGLVYDYRYGFLDYIITPWQNTDEHDWKLVCLYAFIIVPFHTALGALWGVGFVRRFVLEHYVAFGQMLALPWLFHGLSNLLLAEVYNNIDPDFENKTVWMSASIAGPLVFMIGTILAIYLVFMRRIDPSLHRFNRRIRSKVSNNNSNNNNNMAAR